MSARSRRNLRDQSRSNIALPVPAEQRWFWTDRWQERERAVDAHVAAGETTVHDTTEDFLAHLDSLEPE